jgi:hypothetical protein
VAESSRAAIRRSKLINHPEFDLLNRYENHLCDAFGWLHFIAL